MKMRVKKVCCCKVNVYTIICFIMLLFITGSVYASNWYVLGVYNIKDNAGMGRIVRITAKVDKEDRCVLKMKQMRNIDINEAECISVSAVSGKEGYDEVLGPVFDRVPSGEVYVYAVDNDGDLIVADFMKIPIGIVNPFAESIADGFRKAGMGEVSVVYPEYHKYVSKKRRYDFSDTDVIVEGMSKNDVMRVQGPPDREAVSIWFYGDDYICFDSEGKVISYSNIFNKIKNR